MPKQFCVTDFGAKALHGYDNTAAFQAAVDQAVSSGGGVIEIPASDVWPDFYWLSKPVFLNGDNVIIQGQDPASTQIQTWGPAFMVTKHPKFWHAAVPAVRDTDTGKTLPTLDAAGQFIFDTRYKMDLVEFGRNGKYKQNAEGIPPLDEVAPGQFYGIRPRGAVKAVFPGCPFATGGKAGWETIQRATFDFIVYAHDRPIEGGIAGMGDTDYPDPWLFSGNSTDYTFHMALTDDQLVRRSHGRLRFAQPQTPGLHRISIQVDLTKPNTFAVFVDRKPVSVAVEFDGNYTSAFNRFARWEYCEFTLGSRSRQTSQNDVGPVATSDYTILAAKLYPELRYRTNTTTLTKLDNSAVSDNDALTREIAGCLAGLCVQDATDIHLRVTSSSNVNSYGMLVPIGGGCTAVANCGIHNLKIVGVGHQPVGDGLTLGAYLHLQLHNLFITEGFYHAIGSLTGIVSYPLSLRDCRLCSAGVCFSGINQSHLLATNTTFGYIGRAAIKLVGSGSRWSGGMTNDFEPTAEAFFLGYDYGVGAGHQFEDIMIDTEGTRSSPRVAYFYTQKVPFTANNKLLLNNVSFGESSGAPAVFLDDKSPNLNCKSLVTLQSCEFMPEATLLKSTGVNWYGTAEIRRAAIGDVVLDVTDNFSRIQTTHADFAGLPDLGSWRANMHTILNQTVKAEGQPVSWTCVAPGTYGTMTPPRWMPVFAASTSPSQRSSLSGNISASFFGSVRLLVGNGVGLNSRFVQLQTLAVNRLLAWLLNGTPLESRSPLSLASLRFAVGPELVHKDSFIQTSEKLSDWLPNQPTSWTTLASYKANAQPITLRTGAVWDNAGAVLQRPISFFGFANAPDRPDWQTVCLVSGRIPAGSPAAFNSRTLTIAPNNLIFGFAPVAGGWSPYAQEKLLNFLFGYNTAGFPTTFALGLSRDPLEPGKIPANLPGCQRFVWSRQPGAAPTFQTIDPDDSTFVNRAEIRFSVEPQASTTVGTVTHFYLVDDKNNLWFSAELNRPVTIRKGEPMPVFPAGALQIQL